MKKWLKIPVLVLAFLQANMAFAQLVLQPTTAEDLDGFLQSLAKDHADIRWCDGNCAVIRSFRVSGRIADGTLKLEIAGDVRGEKNGVVPVFLSNPPAEITSLKIDDTEVSLVFRERTYYTVLPPGPFVLTGEIRIDRTSSTNFTLPAPVGKVSLDIDDQETLLKSVASGQVGGSFQITPRLAADSTDKAPKNALRLDITRHFTISRDKAFAYEIEARGAQDGQVISIPLASGEKVLKVVPDGATIKPSSVEFTAPGSDATFRIEGEWVAPSVDLVAQPGSVRETWELACEGAYDCHFSGDAEKATHAGVHRWAPQAGEKLAITWEELGTLKARSLVAQRAVLQTERKGDGVKQSLSLDLTSSERDQIYVQLPVGAVPLDMHYGTGAPQSVLKNDKGWVHLSVPQGSETVNLAWEINDQKDLAIPLPKLDVPVGEWVFTLLPGDTRSFMWAGGLPGSPVILFWPRLGFCFLLALVFWLTQRRFFGTMPTSAILFVLLCGGFALLDPEPLFALLALIAAIRLLSRARNQRTIFGWLLELGGVGVLGLLAVASYGHLLDRAFFSSAPFAFESFCQSSLVSVPSGALCWDYALPGPGQVPAPYGLSVPTFALRGFYFFWAVATGYYLYTEILQLVVGLKHYISLGTRPVVARKTDPVAK